MKSFHKNLEKDSCAETHRVSALTRCAAYDGLEALDCVAFQQRYTFGVNK